MKYLALGFFLASFACTTFADSPDESSNHLYRVGIGNEITTPGEVYAGDALYALFEKQNEKWKIVNVSFIPPNITSSSAQEVLVFANDFTIVEPYFLPYLDWLSKKHNRKWGPSDRGIYSCARVYKGEDRPLYNPCESSLTSIDNAVGTAALQTLAGVMSMGLTVAGGATGWSYRVDPEKVKTLVTEAGAIDELRQKQVVLYAEKKLNDYRMSYQFATSAQSLKAFIEKYASYDPDNLLPKVRANLLQIEEREALAAKLKAKQDAERAAQREKEIAEINRLNAMLEKQNAKKRANIIVERGTSYEIGGWTSFSADDDLSWGVVVSRATKRKAVELSNKECQKVTRRKCKSIFTSQRAGHVVVVDSPARVQIAIANSLEQAKATSLDGCAKRTPPEQVCTVQWEGYNGVVGNVQKLGNLQGDCRPRTNHLQCTYQCSNGNCVVSYDNGCKMNVQVRPNLNPITNQWAYPSPGC